VFPTWFIPYPCDAPRKEEEEKKKKTPMEKKTGIRLDNGNMTNSIFSLLYPGHGIEKGRYMPYTLAYPSFSSSEHEQMEHKLGYVDRVPAPHIGGKGKNLLHSAER
jgi:hypothetical protein